MTDQEINEAVAQKLGWKLILDDGVPHWICPKCPMAHIANPDWCRSIAAAWEIWEKLREEGYHRQLYSSWDRRNIVCFQATHRRGIENPLYGEAAVASMAICLAFLKLELTK